jgi:hypothetical protein
MVALPVACAPPPFRLLSLALFLPFQQASLLAGDTTSPIYLKTMAAAGW